MFHFLRVLPVMSFIHRTQCKENEIKKEPKILCKINNTKNPQIHYFSVKANNWHFYKNRRVGPKWLIVTDLNVKNQISDT